MVTCFSYDDGYSRRQPGWRAAGRSALTRRQRHSGRRDTSSPSQHCNNDDRPNRSLTRPMSEQNGGLQPAEAGPSSVGDAKAASTPGTRPASPGPAQAASTPSTEPQNKQQLRRPASHGRLSKLMLPGRSRAASLAHDASPVTAYAGDTASASGRTTPEQRRRSARGAL